MATNIFREVIFKSEFRSEASELQETQLPVELENPGPHFWGASQVQDALPSTCAEWPRSPDPRVELHPTGTGPAHGRCALRSRSPPQGAGGPLWWPQGRHAACAPVSPPQPGVAAAQRSLWTKARLSGPKPGWRTDTLVGTCSSGRPAGSTAHTLSLRSAREPSAHTQHS